MSSPENLPPPIHAALEGFWAGAQLTAAQRTSVEFGCRRYGLILDFLSASPPNPTSRVLDLGGGSGSLSVALHARFGGHYDLVDFVLPPAGTEAHYARYGVESFRSVRLDRPESIEELPRNYDFVLFVEVLEHLLVDPIVLFRSIYNRLGPEGRLLLTTPNMARLGNRWKLARGRSIKEGERFPQDGSGGFGHVIEYTLDELDYLLKWESFVRERARIVQHLPHLSSKGLRRRAIPWLNSGFAERLRLGDDILALYRIVPRPPPGTPRPARI
ncbi:MAG: class I SAM-dependent methyltransferase [Thermoplasmata archaeon]